MQVQLSVFTPKKNRHLMTLLWDQGFTRKIFVVDSLSVSVERWISKGLSEWVSVDGKIIPKSTPSTSEDFLPRLADYLRRQFPLIINLSRDGVCNQ